MNLDNGAVPGSVQEIKKSFQYDDKRVGALGSILYLGISFGALSSAFFMGKIPYKVILLMAFIGNAAGLFLFIVFDG